MSVRVVPILKRLGVAVSALLLFLTLSSLAIELFDAAPGRTSPIMIWGVEEDSAFGTPGGTFRAHPLWFWEPQPGGKYMGDEINADGYRGRVFAKNKTARVRIATMGDSSTFGFRVREEEAWSRRLEAKLRERGYDVEVVNFGVIGFSIFQGNALLRGRVLDYHPDVVCVAFGAINEHFPVDGTLDDFEKAKVLGSLRYRTYLVLARYHLYRWLEQFIKRPKPAERPAPAPGVPVRPNMRVTPEEFEDLMSKMQAAARGAGGELVIVEPPRMRFAEDNAPIIVRFTRAIERSAQTLGAPLVDVYTPFREHEVAGNPSGPLTTNNDWFLDSVHPSVAGHDRYAEIVAERLIAAGLLAKAR
jgi:lysophospholipase L1-like esterase